jgi:hypothetical protein
VASLGDALRKERAVVVTFPATAAQFALLVLGVAALSTGLSSMLPVRWGWKAFPLVALALSVIAALMLVVSIVFADAIFRGQGGNFVVPPRTALIIIAVAGAAFGLTLSARRRSR